MNNNIAALIKWVFALATLIGLIVLYRTLPLTGGGALDGLSKFNTAAILMGFICLLVFFITLKLKKNTGTNKSETTSFERGSNAVLIALALLILEMGIVGIVGVNSDMKADPRIASMRDCYVQETSIVNKIRGIDKVLICTDPAGNETLFAIDEETANRLGNEKQDLTIEYHGMTNRIISISK